MSKSSKKKNVPNEGYETMQYNVPPANQPSYGRKPIDIMVAESNITENKIQTSYSPVYKTRKDAEFNGSSELRTSFGETESSFHSPKPSSHLDGIISPNKSKRNSNRQERANSRSPTYELSSPDSHLYPIDSLNEVTAYFNGQGPIELYENGESHDSFSRDEEEEDSSIHHYSPQTSTTVKQRAQHIPKTEKPPDTSHYTSMKKLKPVKKITPTEPKSRYNFLYLSIGILIVVILSVVGFIWYYKIGMGSFQTPNFLQKTSPSSKPQIDVAAIMGNLERDFKEQPSMTFRMVKSAIQTLNKQNPKEPAIISLLAERGAEDVVRRFARQLVESVSRYTDVVTISGSAFSEQDPDTAKKTIDDLLNGGLKENKLGAVFVDQLDYIPGEAALIFHTYCDHENAPFKRVVFVMTVASHETKLELAEPKEWDTKFQEHLYRSWSDVGVDQISSLMSRLTVRVAAIVPKDEG